MELFTKNISIGYSAGHTLVSGINFRANAGDIVLITGDNGFGKTTLMKTFAGILPALSGEMSSLEKKNIGFASSESLILFPNMTGAEIVEFFSDVNSSVIAPQASEISLFRVLKTKKILEMSSGMKQVLKLVITTLENKTVIFWDEPLRGLSDSTKIEVIQFAKKVSCKKTLIVTEHSHRDWDGASTQKFNIDQKQWFNL